MTNKKRDTIGEQIVALEAQLAEPAHAHKSRAEMRDLLAGEVEQWLDHGADLVAIGLETLASGGHSDLLMTRVSDHSYAEDMRAFMTFAIGPAAMLARFEPLLAEMPEGRDAAARARHLGEIKAELVKREVREEGLLREADTPWTPRPGQRPEAAILIRYGT